MSVAYTSCLTIRKHAGSHRTALLRGFQEPIQNNKNPPQVRIQGPRTPAGKSATRPGCLCRALPCLSNGERLRGLYLDGGYRNRLVVSAPLSLRALRRAPFPLKPEVDGRNCRTPEPPTSTESQGETGVRSR